MVDLCQARRQGGVRTLLLLHHENAVKCSLWQSKISKRFFRGSMPPDSITTVHLQCPPPTPPPPPPRTKNPGYAPVCSLAKHSFLSEFLMGLMTLHHLLIDREERAQACRFLQKFSFCAAIDRSCGSSAIFWINWPDVTRERTWKRDPEIRTDSSIFVKSRAFVTARVDWNGNDCFKNSNDCFKNSNDCFKWQRAFTKGKIALPPL